jgi:hypothetical protein
MTTTTITAADATNGLVQTGGNDGTLTLRTGPSGGKVNALSIDATGKGTLLVPPVNAANPCFSAYQSTLQALTGAAYTKVQFQTKEFDLTTAFDAVTNYRFTPQVAGYYQVNACCVTITSNYQLAAAIYKNGAPARYGSNTSATTSSVGQVAAMIYLNGSTDYIEFYMYSSSAQNTTAGSSFTYFQAALITRSA